MLSPKTIEKFERDNARSAAAILKDPARFGAGLVQWATLHEKQVRAERAAREAEQAGQGRLPFRGTA